MRNGTAFTFAGQGVSAYRPALNSATNRGTANFFIYDCCKKSIWRHSTAAVTSKGEHFIYEFPLLYRDSAFGPMPRLSFLCVDGMKMPRRSAQLARTDRHSWTNQTPVKTPGRALPLDRRHFLNRSVGFQGQEGIFSSANSCAGARKT